MQGRTELTEQEKGIMELMKDTLSIGINELKSNGVRHANIQIELLWHIKNILKEE